MVVSVERIAEGIDKHKWLAVGHVPHIKTVLQRQIDATDRHAMSHALQ